MNIGNITSDNFNLDGNGKDIQIEVYEQLIEQLQQENQKYKEKYENAVADYETTMFEKEQLKKQVDEYKKLGFKYLQDKNNNLEIQQKEFIEYMNKTIEELQCDDVDDEEMKGYLIQIIDTFEEILQKYKEIIGGKDAIK